MAMVLLWLCSPRPKPAAPAASPRQQDHLHMFNLHTGESPEVTYRAGNEYVLSNLEENLDGAMIVTVVAIRMA